MHPCFAQSRRRRGYLLWEAAIGAGILAILLAGIMSQLASFRLGVTQASKREIAASLAKTKADELVAAKHSTVGSTTQSIPGYPGYSMTFQVVQSGLHNASDPPLPSADELHEVRVQVSYPAANGTGTVSFARLKRDQPSPP